MGQVCCKGGIPKSKGIEVIEVPTERAIMDKWCSYGKHHSPATKDHFFANAAHSDGLDNACKSCSLIKRTIAKRRAEYGKEENTT